MPVKQRIICKLLIEHGSQPVAVKFQRFTESRRIVGDPVSVMRTMEDQTLDEFQICFLGVADPQLVREMTRAVFCPVSVAGGIHTLSQVDDLIHGAGADKVVVKDVLLGPQVAAKYGAQAVIFPVDYRGRAPRVEIPPWAGEVLLTDIERDGMGCGLDVDALGGYYSGRPVVLAGGVGKLRHVSDAFVAGASGVCVSSMFAFSSRSPVNLRSWLVSEGINVRAA